MDYNFFDAEHWPLSAFFIGCFAYYWAKNETSWFEMVLLRALSPLPKPIT